MTSVQISVEMIVRLSLLRKTILIPEYLAFMCVCVFVVEITTLSTQGHILGLPNGTMIAAGKPAVI